MKHSVLRFASLFILLSLTISMLGVTHAQATIHLDPPTGIDLSTYVRTGRYNLPEPTRTTPPTNSLLAQEASGVTYNWDADTLFVVGDGSTSVVQISKTGTLIDSMTLALGSSPQGTEFYDTEGIAYIGGGQFVLVEERDRQVVKFTYTANTTLTRGATQTVKLGTTVGNVGLEGITYDTMTSGFIPVKEITPEGIFQTGIDFNAGTATNGSSSTVNAINLFDPTLIGLSDIADVFSLSNIPSLNVQPDYDHILVLSQEDGKIVEVDRIGNVYSSLQIVSDPGNPLSLANQQHEGLTMDSNGILYVVNENGGGDFDHPQLWVYEHSAASNAAPTTVALDNALTSLLENSNTTSPLKVADIIVTDDGLGTNNLSVSGTDASFFQITGTSLYIKAGTVLDYETKINYDITIEVDDTSVGTTPDATTPYNLTLTDQANETPTGPTLFISETAPWSSGNSPVAADWFEVTNTSNSTVNITGWKMDDNSNLFSSSVPLSGISNIAPGESVIFIESTATNQATVIANFKSVWFNGNLPAGLQVGTYDGSLGSVGLSTGGDSINLFDSGGTLIAKISFGASPAVPGPYTSFNNALGLNNVTISTMSMVGTNGAFAAVNDASEIGSPGSIGKLFISEVAPWSSNNGPLGADWFEVTNTRATAVDITGWKIDDNSGSAIAAVALNGITSIAPGESVIFIETNDLAGETTLFLNTWFGASPPSGLHTGNYNGTSVDLSPSGDAVNLYNSTFFLQANVAFGASSPNAPFRTLDNAAGLNNTTITQMSALGTNGAFVAANDTNEIGSPGSNVIITPAPTSTPTQTLTPSLTPTMTETSIPTVTSTLTESPTETMTATQTSTPTVIATETVTATVTAIPTNTATRTLTPAATFTKTATKTAIKTPTKTRTPSVITITLTSIAAQDGWVLETSETSSIGGTMNPGMTTFNLGDDAGKRQYRGILSFNTSSIPDNATISSVMLKVKKKSISGGGNPVAIFQGFMADIKNGTFGTAALQIADFQTFGTGSYGPFVIAPVSNIYSINLTAGKLKINKLATNSGLTQIRLRFKLDDNSNLIANYLSLFSGNATAATDRPQLVITYSVP